MRIQLYSKIGSELHTYFNEQTGRVSQIVYMSGQIESVIFQVNTGQILLKDSPECFHISITERQETCMLKFVWICLWH